MSENQYEIYEMRDVTQCNSGVSTAKSMNAATDTKSSNSVLIRVGVILGFAILLMLAGIMVWMHLMEVKF